MSGISSGVRLECRMELHQQQQAARVQKELERWLQRKRVPMSIGLTAITCLLLDKAVELHAAGDPDAPKDMRRIAAKLERLAAAAPGDVRNVQLALADAVIPDAGRSG